MILRLILKEKLLLEVVLKFKIKISRFINERFLFRRYILDEIRTYFTENPDLSFSSLPQAGRGEKFVVYKLAAGGGFEPPIPFPVYLFSRQARSTTPASRLTHLFYLSAFIILTKFNFSNFFFYLFEL